LYLCSNGGSMLGFHSPSPPRRASRRHRRRIALANPSSPRGGWPDSGATTRPLSSVGAWCLLFVRFHLPTSRARTNTVIVLTPKHEFPHFPERFHPSPRRVARLGCHHPTTVFSGRVVSSLCPFSPTDLPRAHKRGHSSDPTTRIPTFPRTISPLPTPSNRHFRAPRVTKHPPTSTSVRAPVTAHP